MPVLASGSHNMPLLNPCLSPSRPTAITPGRLKDRKTSRIVVNRSTLLTASVFDLFLGDEPLDEEGKKDVGHAMLWAANGFRCVGFEGEGGAGHV
jgi:hypothetical protein